MATGSVQHQIRINAVPAAVDIPTRLNIKKRRERVVYRSLSNRDNINIAYVTSQQVTPATNMVISDRSTSLTQNRIPRTQSVTTATTQTFTLNVDKFLITDTFTPETATLPETPVFYAHVLKNFNEDLVDFNDRTLLAIEFADESLRTINYSQYVLDTDTGTLFNNIENSFNDNDSSFDITFVKYTVRIDNDVQIFHELVSNQPIYSQADFDDVDAFGNILPGRKKYLVEQLGDQQFLITMPSSARYAYKETPESRLKILRPTAIDVTAPWNVRVSNGQFITALQTNATTFVNHKYHLAEFDAQSFSPFPPYKFQAEQKATWITASLIHVPKNIVFEEGLGFFTDVIVRDRKNVLKYVYSNDPNRIGAIFQDETRYTDGILSIDASNGFLELDDPVRDDDIITVSYYTEEDEYEFTAIDFNPVNNLNILTQRVVLYVNPETALTGSLDRTLYYLLVNSLGEITFSSQVAESAGGAIDLATSKMLTEDFNADGTPDHTFYYDQESTASGLASRTSGVNLAYADEISFIDKYTTESVLLTTTVEPSGTVLENFTDNPRYLVLGDVYVGEAQSPDNLTTLDVREQGGGIKDEYRSTALQEQPEVSWYWDFIAKRPYPGATAFMAEIPQTLLSDHGGTFTHAQITDIIERHMDAGGYAIVDDYGIDPVVTEATVGSGSLTISWPSYGDTVRYNVYYSTSIDRGFVLSGNEIDDVPSGNTFTVDALTPSTKYFVKLGALDEDDDESFGPTVPVTTAASFT